MGAWTMDSLWFSVYTNKYFWWRTEVYATIKQTVTVNLAQGEKARALLPVMGLGCNWRKSAYFQRLEMGWLPTSPCLSIPVGQASNQAVNVDLSKIYPEQVLKQAGNENLPRVQRGLKLNIPIKSPVPCLLSSCRNLAQQMQVDGH